MMLYLFQGMFKPIIDLDKCTSCGFRLSRCPTRAIEYIINVKFILKKYYFDI